MRSGGIAVAFARWRPLRAVPAMRRAVEKHSGVGRRQSRASGVINGGVNHGINLYGSDGELCVNGMNAMKGYG